MVWGTLVLLLPKYNLIQLRILLYKVIRLLESSGILLQI